MKKANETYVSVYGTLRKGERANYKLDSCEFIEESTETLPFTMVNLGSFPALMSDSDSRNIVIETYKIKSGDNDTMKKLDEYEGYPVLYDKKIVKLKSGIESYIYYMNSEEKSYHGVKIESGDWKNR